MLSYTKQLLTVLYTVPVCVVTIPPLSISGGAHTTVPSIIDFNTGTHNITTFMHLIKLRTDRHTPPKCLSLLVTRIKDEHFKILLNVDDVSQDWDPVLS